MTWWLSGLIRQEREHICDDLAVAVNQDHINYIKALTTMEELNSKSPLLASAMTGSKKKLLCRVKRLLSPVKLRKGFSEGIIACVLLVGLIFTLSLNALSVIPNAYDLTGRESGERVYSLIPFHNDELSATNTNDKITAPEIEPDTLIAKSKSGKVTISVYTDSTGQFKQEQLDRIAESMDRQAEQSDKAREQYRIQVRNFDEAKDDHDKECKVIVIRKSDSLCPVPPERPMLKYIYSNPDQRTLEHCRKQFFSFDIDSLAGINEFDTLILMRPGPCFELGEIEGLEWSAQDLQDQMKDVQIDIERHYRDAEGDYRDMEREYRKNEKDFQKQELDRLYFNENPPFPPPDPQMREFPYEFGTAPDERIIRQELIDDGLATPRKKYIIDLDSHGMYINGEKQPKDTYRKYKHLVESLEISDLESDGTYRLIF